MDDLLIHSSTATRSSEDTPVLAAGTASGYAAWVPASECFWSLPHRSEAACTARRLAIAALRSWGMGEQDMQSVLLVVSELVTNAVEHALPPVALHLEHFGEVGTVHVEVADGGPANAEGPWTATCEAEEHGRGELIIDALATARGTRVRSGGSIYWADLPICS
ncbi:ATP-binding protein [Streptomyces sp. NPDC055709]